MKEEQRITRINKLSDHCTERLTLQYKLYGTAYHIWGSKKERETYIGKLTVYYDIQLKNRLGYSFKPSFWFIKGISDKYLKEVEIIAKNLIKQIKKDNLKNR